MNLLVFTSKKSEERILYNLGRIMRMEVYNNIKAFLKRFHVPKNNLDLMLLLIGNQKDLEDLITIKELFFDIPIILVLPDRKKMTVREGLKFFPRYISYMDSKQRDVEEVLKKIHSNMN